MKTFEDFIKEHNIEKNNLNSEIFRTNKKKNFNISNIEENENISKEKNEKALNKLKKITENKNIEKDNEQEKYKNLEGFDEAKTKVLKYVLYKKRTEQEIRKKFSSIIDENLLEDVIQNLIDNGYINDNNYIERAVNEFIALKTLSKKEIRMKLYSKGINNDEIDTYFSNNMERLQEYELACAKKIIIKKKSQMEDEEIENFLYKKGYESENIKLAFEEIDN